MRIDRLDLIAYGPFIGKSLDLSDGASGLHLIYGDNEAGKSTSLRALIAWLFGIPTHTTDNYLHSHSQLRIGGKLRLSGGEDIEFVRRKGKKGTLLEPGTDAPLDDSILLPFLPVGIDENLFTKLYGIDHGGLIAGGKELLNQSGDLGQALFSAAVGTASLRKILSDLRNSAEDIFKPRASTKLVNQAISSFKEAQKRIKDSSLPVAEWKRLQKELANTHSAIQQVEEDINGKSKEKSRLDRLDRVKGALAERRGVMARIEVLGEVLLLPEDFDEKHKNASDNLQKVSEARDRDEAKLSRLKEETEALNVRNELLDNEEAILAIHKELGAVETAIKDRPQQDGKRRLLRNEAEQLLKGVRPDLGIDNSDQLRPLTNNKKWISGLAQKHSLLNQKKEKAEATLRDVEDEQETIKKELGEQAQSNLDLSELKAAVADARKAGDLEQRLSDSQKRASDEKSACEGELSRLGRFSGIIEALSRIALPVSETLDRFERQFNELSENIRDYGRRRKELEGEQKQAEQDLKALLLTSDVPTISELEGARSVRNTGWNLIKRKYIEEIDVEKEIAGFASNSDLPTFYEQKVDVADHVSDQLRLATDQVVKRADFEAKIENLKSRLNDTIEEVIKANEEKEVYQKEWNSIWKPLGVDSGSPREMKQWLLRVDKLLSNVQAANTISGDARKLSADCKVLKESVSLQISRFDDSIDLQEMSLEAMINLCEQRIEREDAALERKRQLEHSFNDTEIRIKRGREELTSIKNDLSIWVQEWGQAIDGLGLKHDVHPEQATEAFDQLLAYFDKFDKSEELRRRIYGIDQVAEKFEKKVLKFADSIGFKRNGQTAITIAAQLNRDLNEAREARASLKKIESQEKEIREEIEDADITIRTAQYQLASLRDQASVEADDELESAGENSRKTRDLQQKLDTLEQELSRNGDGLCIQELEKEASESDIDAIEGELERVTSELKELQANRDTLRDQRQTLQNEIRAKDGSAVAANASEEAEQQLATMVFGVEQYLRLQIAALILEQRIEDYRKKNQAPVLARAGEIFSKLTLSSYANLRDELNKSGKPILLGVRSNDVEVSVDRMSDGTRDQLFLSLRLATLEQHLSKGEPMPFVVDDILIGFDENRTRVCLEVLSKLALSTQVLLFTHHRRVLELAGELEAKAGIYNHELQLNGNRC
ncbi:MAG: chromosome segregation protein SMC [Desulfobacterales bacterium S5133MH4]|nr:MAG: chromosome segregation protein SMC [Desulfobacterales bacterium S5133MH4]